nr:Beta-ketoacyl synthase [uncultured bacterium]
MSTEPATNLSPLKQAFLALERTQAKLQALERAQTEPIAILGLGCRMPGGVATPADFWRLLQGGVDAIREVPPDRWDLAEYYDADPSVPGKIYSRCGGFLNDVRGFDADFFGISPREAMSLDPQQRMLLETSWEALESAALPADRLDRSPTGVFVGISSFDYGNRMTDRGLDKIDAYLASGNCHSSAAGRLSYFFGFQGPCVALDTACSSSLVAVHLACQSLRAGECSLALAGGVNALIYPVLSINFAKARMLSPDGRCKTFDAAADGYVRGEGAGVVVLKRLSDALADGDPVLAVIRGSAVNQDGPSGGLTVPNGPAQEAVIRRALAMGKIEPQQVSYLEAHGTGTQLGDPIELGALKAVFGGKRPAPLVVGSVKTNIGHLEAAAGIAGLIKLVLMLQHKQIPAHLHFHTPNPNVPWHALPIKVPTELAEWEVAAGARIAGLSSFGFSGTNAHVVLAEAPSVVAPAAAATPDPQVLCLSAKSEAALDQLCLRYADLLAADQGVSLSDMAYTLTCGRVHFTCRAAIVANSPAEAVELWRQAAVRAPGERIFRNRLQQTDPINNPLLPERLSNHGADTLTAARNQAQAYVTGTALPPNHIVPPADRRKLHLPTYCFQRRDYWFEESPPRKPATSEAAELAAAEHPLLGRRVQNGDASVFERELPAESLRFLTDHQIGNVPYLPASAYLELALAAADRGLPKSKQTSISLRNVELRKALPLVNGNLVTVQTALSSDKGQFQIHLSSQRRGENGDGRTLHAAATAARSDEQAALAGDFAAKMPAASSNDVSPAEIYEKFQSRGLNYGPAFRALQRVHAAEQQIFCEVQLPQALRGDARSYLIHPVLLDGCFQALVSQLRPRSGEPFFLPVRVERALWLSPAADQIWCRATVHQASGQYDSVVTADLEIYSPAGQKIAALEGVRFQQVASDLAAANSVPARADESAASAHSPNREQFLAQLNGANKDERRTLLIGLLQRQLVRVLRRDAAETPDLGANMFQLGLDSLMAVEFVYEINRSLGIRLPAEALLLHPTLAELVAELPRYLDAAGNSSDAASPASAAAGPSTPWFAHCRPKPSARARLFCFHHLGGAASLYSEWGDAFPAEIEVFPIQLPGREGRQDDPPITDFLELIEILSGEMLDYVDRPFAFFGNSGGSLVAFELAQQLRRRFGLQPELLFAGSLWAPHLVAAKAAAWSDADAGLLSQLGIVTANHSQEAAEVGGREGNGSVMTAVAEELPPHVRADLQLFATYEYHSRPPLDCPITTFLGRDDQLVARHEILEWGSHTNSAFRLEMFPGTHSTWHTARRALVRTIVQDLTKDRSS